MAFKVRAIVASSLIFAAGAAPLTAFDAPAHAQPAQEAQQPTVISHSGSLWVKASNKVEGLYTIERRNDGTYVVLGSDFKTKSGPDLKLVLSPLAADKVKGKTALNGSLNLGLLKSNTGKQAFRVPEGTDLTRYRSVLIHCEQYTKLWSAAPLSPGEVVAHGDSWTRKSNKITGSWEIAKTSSGYELRIGDDFKTRNAPDLKFVLSPNTAGAASNSNALNGGLVVSPLRSSKGAQTYRFDAGVDLSRYRSLLIHCEQYTKLWGGADLS